MIGLGGLQHGLHAGAAQAVDGDAGDLDGEAGEQGGHAGDVAVVLAGLVGAAEVHVGELLHRRAVVLGEAADHVGGEVIGAHRRQGAAEPADRRANGGDDDGRAGIRGHAPPGYHVPALDPGGAKLARSHDKAARRPIRRASPVAPWLVSRTGRRRARRLEPAGAG
jgi:hypothetical protein